MANVRTGRRSGLVFRGGRNRRDTVWVGITETSTALAAANTAALIISLNAVALALRPFTVVRARGVWSMRSDQTAATEQQFVGLGHSVVSAQASAVGITAVPTPFTDIASDKFFVFEQWPSTFVVNSAVGTEVYQSRSYDSRAMRKVQDGEDVVIVLENSGITLGTTVLHSGRWLFKLH